MPPGQKSANQCQDGAATHDATPTPQHTKIPNRERPRGCGDRPGLLHAHTRRRLRARAPPLDRQVSAPRAGTPLVVLIVDGPGAAAAGRNSDDKRSMNQPHRQNTDQPTHPGTAGPSGWCRGSPRRFPPSNGTGGGFWTGTSPTPSTARSVRTWVLPPFGRWIECMARPRGIILSTTRHHA